VRGFRAFELYLDAHPRCTARRHARAARPVAAGHPEYAEYLGAIQRARAACNDRFQRTAGCRRLRIEDNFPQSVAAYKQYDVLLVNAIFDGLNLVAKEAPLVNERDGVLILSENAGAHEELGRVGADVNPFDVEEQAQAITRRSRCGGASGARGSRRSASTCASTTSAPGSRRSSRISTGGRRRRAR
jgi:trehalose 6-phosphate synthase